MAGKKMLEKESFTPVPYVEPKHGSPECFWPNDPWDLCLPSSPGFIGDFVAHMRGYETPTAYCIWAAIFFLAAVIKREAWIEWGYGKMFTNFYVILIGPPGIAKKGTTMWAGYNIFKDARKYISDRNLREIKRFNVLLNKASAEMLVTTMLENRKRHGEFYDFLDKDGNVKLVDGKPIRYERTSEISIIVPELAVMLSRADYAKPITTTLMDLYDCHEKWEVATQARGTETLKYLCTNFFGGVTPKGLAKSIPEEASEDGFLSRCILVYQKGTNRIYPRPRMVGPSQEELSKKLAWVAEHTLGKHTFEKDAQDLYDSWYVRWRRDLELADRPFASSRMAVQVIQLALIMKASRYSTEPVIKKEDVANAIAIVEKTAKSYTGLFDNVEMNGFFDKLGPLGRKLQRKGMMTRKALLTSTRNPVEDLNTMLNHLHQAGKIKIIKDGHEQRFISKDGDEEYHWIKGACQIDETPEDEA